MSKRRKFSPEFKAEIVLSVISGAKTSAEVCREHNLQPRVFGRWKNQLLDNAPQLFRNKADDNQTEERMADLERMIGRLTMELEISKKASAILRSTSNRRGG